MKIETFIFVHDEQIILEFLKVKKFSSLPNLKYVFLGNKSVEKVKDLDNIIIARDLKYNMEEYPKFTSFTGWYALWKNNLINSDYVNLFEYDINIKDELPDRIENIINENSPDFIGYQPLSLTAFDYISNIRWVSDIIPSIKKHYDVDIYDLVNKIIQNKEYGGVWSCTSNSTFSRQSFIEYMTWFEKLISDLKDTQTCGHAHERSTSFFCFIHKKNISIIHNLMSHFQLDSHKTQGHHVDFDLSMKRLTSE
jgi:hypothetical protein